MTAQRASTASVGMAASLEQQAHKDAMVISSEQRRGRREPAAGAELRGGMTVGLHLGNGEISGRGAARSVVADSSASRWGHGGRGAA
jgi:hypothetical protein